MKDTLNLASCKFLPEGEGKVTCFIETWSFPENFEEIMKNWDERILKIDIFSITEASQQMTRDSLEVKQCIQDGSLNGTNADSRRSFNITDMKSSGSKQGKNEEVVENIQPKEYDNIDESPIIVAIQYNDPGDEKVENIQPKEYGNIDESPIIVAIQYNDPGDWNELVPISRKATDLEEI